MAVDRHGRHLAAFRLASRHRGIVRQRRPALPDAHGQEPDAVGTITPEDTLPPALNERSADTSEERWVEDNRKFNGLLARRGVSVATTFGAYAAPNRFRRTGFASKFWGCRGVELALRTGA